MQFKIFNIDKKVLQTTSSHLALVVKRSLRCDQPDIEDIITSDNFCLVGGDTNCFWVNEVMISASSETMADLYEKQFIQLDFPSWSYLPKICMGSKLMVEFSIEELPKEFPNDEPIYEHVAKVDRWIAFRYIDNMEKFDYLQILHNLYIEEPNDRIINTNPINILKQLAGKECHYHQGEFTHGAVVRLADFYGISPQLFIGKLSDIPIYNEQAETNILLNSFLKPKLTDEEEIECQTNLLKE